MPDIADPAAQPQSSARPGGNGMPRRRLIAGLVSTAVLAGSTACSSKSTPPSAGRATPLDPDVALIAALRSAKAELIGRYDAVIADFPLLESKLTVFRADHVGHLQALGAAVPTPSSSPSPRPTPNPTGAGQVQAVAALAAAEHVAAAARPDQARGAHDPALARLIAAIGGCEAAHAALLKRPAARKS